MQTWVIVTYVIGVFIAWQGIMFSIRMHDYTPHTPESAMLLFVSFFWPVLAPVYLIVFAGKSLNDLFWRIFKDRKHSIDKRSQAPSNMVEYIRHHDDGSITQQAVTREIMDLLRKIG